MNNKDQYIKEYLVSKPPTKGNLAPNSYERPKK